LNYDIIYLRKSKNDVFMTNVTMPKTNTRQKIISLLRRQGLATPAEIAKALRLTPADIRHHLSKLVSDGLVAVAGLRNDPSRGRPHKTYRLSRLVVGDNLALLSSALLTELLQGLTPEEQLTQLRSLAGRLSPGLAAERFFHISRRLTATVEKFNAMHYQARWEAHAAGPRLIFGQCPYAALIETCPALCVLDKFLLEENLFQPVEQLAKLEQGERGLPVCVFMVR